MLLWSITVSHQVPLWFSFSLAIDEISQQFSAVEELQSSHHICENLLLCLSSTKLKFTFDNNSNMDKATRDAGIVIYGCLVHNC